MLPFILSAASLLLCAAAALEYWRGIRRVPRLEDVAPAERDLPAVSIIFGARDEEAAIEEAVRSHLSQDHPDFEVIAVDDRSSDRTPELLSQLARASERLRVIRIDELPPGWLGKCNALRRGAEAASGEWLLFTDADIVMERSVLRRSIALARQRRLDHLAIAPYARLPGALLAFTPAFGLLFSLFVRPWRVGDPASAAHAGIGAFNLVRAEAYGAIGGHERVRLSPDDDMRLGKVLKRAGRRQGFALGQTLLRVDWYASLPALVRGLEKAAFAGLDYSLPRTALASLVPVFLSLWPVAGLLFGGWTALVSAGACSLSIGLYLHQARTQRISAWTAALFPLCCIVFVWILWSSACKALARGGIEWRGTFYRLEELRRSLA